MPKFPNSIKLNTLKDLFKKTPNNTSGGFNEKKFAKEIALALKESGGTKSNEVLNLLQKMMNPQSRKAESLPVIVANAEEIGRAVPQWIPDNPASGKGQDLLLEQTKIQHAGVPEIFNVTIAIADTEYSQLLPEGTKRFKIYGMNSARTALLSSVLRYAYETLGDSDWSSETYIPIPRGNSDEESGLNLSGKTIYLSSSATGVVIIKVWK